MDLLLWTVTIRAWTESHIISCKVAPAICATHQLWQAVLSLFSFHPFCSTPAGVLATGLHTPRLKRHNGGHPKGVSCRRLQKSVPLFATNTVTAAVNPARKTTGTKIPGPLIFYRGQPQQNTLHICPCSEGSTPPHFGSSNRGSSTAKPRRASRYMGLVRGSRRSGQRLRRHTLRLSSSRSSLPFEPC